MATDERRIEAIARKLCEIRGLDPDVKVSRGEPTGLAVLIYLPRWKAVAEEEVQPRLEMDAAIAATPDTAEETTP